MMEEDSSELDPISSKFEILIELISGFYFLVASLMIKQLVPTFFKLTGAMNTSIVLLLNRLSNFYFSLLAVSIELLQNLISSSLRIPLDLDLTFPQF
jgi:hypothetical protein